MAFPQCDSLKKKSYYEGNRIIESVPYAGKIYARCYGRCYQFSGGYFVGKRIIAALEDN